MHTPSPSEILIEPLADAYAKAARTGANMRGVANALENIRDAATGESPLFSLWYALDEQIGKAGAGAMREVLVEFRNRTLADVQAAELRRISSQYERDPAAGVRAWLESVVRCFGDGNWRLSFLEQLVHIPAPVENHLAAPFHQRPALELVAQLALQQRWGELEDWFLFLGRHPQVAAPWRCRQLLLAGEVRLYFHRHPARAEDLFQQAADIDPPCPRLPVTRAERLLELGSAAQLKEAREILQQLTLSRPSLVEGWVNLGDLAERDGDLTAAESFFRQAMDAVPGSIDGPMRLYRLFLKSSPTRSDWREAHASDREELRAQILALDPESGPSLDVATGDVLYSQGLRRDAIAAYQPALEHSRTRVAARLGCALSAIDEATSPGMESESAGAWLSRARDWIQQARTMAPSSPNVAWTVITLAAAEGRWPDAVEACRQLASSIPGYAGVAGLRSSEILRQSGDYATAAIEIRRIADAEPALLGLAQAANDLGEDAYRKGGNEALAEEMFHLGSRLRDDSLRYDFLNRLGNLRYWQDRSAEAVDLYREAIATRPEPKDPVHYSNLALGLERIRKSGQQIPVYTEMVRALREAVRLAPNEPDYPPRLETAETMLGFLQRFGEAALDLKLAGTPIRVTLHPSLLPAILTEGRRELSPIAQEEIQALRERIRLDSGVSVPGISFSDLGDGSGEGGHVLLSIADDPPADLVQVEPGPAPESTRALMACVESLLHRHRARFVTHDMVAGLLAKLGTPPADLIRNRPSWLTPFVGELRRAVAAGESILDLDVRASGFIQRQGPPPAEEPPPRRSIPPPSAVFCVQHPGDTPEQVLTHLKSLMSSPLFAGSGVLPPAMSVEPASEGSGITVALGSARVPWPAGAETRPEESEALGRQLLTHGAELFDENQLAYRLFLLESTHPCLVTSARATRSLGDLHARLVERLRSGGHLRNLPDALEDTLNAPRRLHSPE
ncbi:MAG: tetratricopeptide repeat protein [Verrucomicrobiales bacterium]|nr:tetratricopeptide repeat protein [Verrucomicrobiales bacterium]